MKVRYRRLDDLSGRRSHSVLLRVIVNHVSGEVSGVPIIAIRSPAEKSAAVKALAHVTESHSSPELFHQRDACFVTDTCV